MKKLIIAFLSVIILSLASCSINETQTTETNTSEKSTTEDPFQISLDDSLITDALSLNSSDLCDQIKNPDKKDSCKLALKDLEISKDAVSKVDSKLCEDIVGLQYKEACIANIDAILKNKEESKQATENYYSMFDIQSEAMNKKDYTKCDEIEDEQIKATCKYNIIIETVKTSKNPAICENIGLENLVSECKNSINN